MNTAFDINDKGWIMGDGYNPHGEYCGYILQPVHEPTTLSLLALGSLAMLRKHK